VPSLGAAIQEALSGWSWSVLDRRSGSVLLAGSADTRGFAHVMADAAIAHMRA
jgi:hypothetical protein